MGLAATQVRLLQLTARQHRIEYQAQRIQAQKLQLANDSDRAYSAYITALDAKKIQYKYVENDGSLSYIDATFNNMCTYSQGSDNVQTPYALEILKGDKAGKFYVTANTYNGKTISQVFDDCSPWEYVEASDVNDRFGTTFSEDDKTDEFKTYQKKYIAETEFAPALAGDDYNAEDYFSKLYLVLINGKGLVEFNEDKKINDQKCSDSNEWLTNMIANGEVLLHKYDVSGGDDFTGAWIENNISTDTMLQEVADEKELKKAEATYEAETTRIERKDSQYDTLLSQTETERSAIKTEMEDLKQVRSDNVDRAFKLFS